jgi:hypothetical protein
VEEEVLKQYRRQHGSVPDNDADRDEIVNSGYVKFHKEPSKRSNELPGVYKIKTHYDHKAHCKHERSGNAKKHGRWGVGGCQTHTLD